MALANPAIDPPRLPSPTKRSIHSPSPSRSPIRQYHPRDNDPLLRDLSPTTTLRAFRNDGEAQDQLGRGLESASPAQRALGAKAAQACIDLREWAREVVVWEWPGTFEEPEQIRKKQRMSSLSFFSLASRPGVSRSTTQEDYDGDQAQEEYWGSLPKTIIQQYEKRSDEIAQGLEELDVEELKDFVLSAHSQSSFGGADIDDSIGAIGADTNLRHLDDFTSLITATILSALPFLSRLTRLLHTWHIRLTILRAASSYLHDLRQARTDLDHGWAALAVSNHPAAADAMKKSNASFTRETMTEMKYVVSKQVRSLGRRLDRFLDELEGREEVVPERWIEDFEVLEKQYGNWVVQAERKVIEDEWIALTAYADKENAENAVDSGAREMPDSATTTTVVGPATTTSTIIGSGLETETYTYTETSGPVTTTATTIVDHLGPSEERRGRDISTAHEKPQQIPFVVASYVSRPDQPTPLAELPTAIDSTSRSVSPLPRSNTLKSMDSDSSQNVKKRAAFLNGEIEKGDGLIKSRSAPIVRPFEHASNAFTRLFKQKEGLKHDEDTAFGNMVRRKDSKDAESMRKSSVPSVKGVMNRDKNDENRENGATATPRLSRVSSAGSKTGRASTGRPSTERMEYGDMARAPDTPISEEMRTRRKSLGSWKSPRKSRDKSAMDDGDMVRMPEFDREEIETRSRSRSFGRRSKPKTPTNDRSVMGYGDLAANPDLVHPESLRRSEESSRRGKENRPGTPKKKSLEKARAQQTLDFGDMAQVAIPSHDIGGDGAVKRQPDYLAPAPELEASKRASKQNITALPQLQPPKFKPQTYKPTGLHSPFHSPIEPEPQGLDMPEDWPLSNVPSPRHTPSPTKDISSETVVARAASGNGEREGVDHSNLPGEPSFGTDDFDRAFVRSIPAQPVNRPMSRDIGPEEMEVFFMNAGPNGFASGEVIPHRDDDDDGAIIWTSKPGRDRSWMMTGISETSRRLDWNDQPPPTSSREQKNALQSSLPRPVSVVAEADEEGSSSAGESEEEFGIKRRTDNAAGYFGRSKAGHSRKASNSMSAARNRQRSNSTPVNPGYLNLRDGESSTGSTGLDEFAEPRRASLASIKSRPRSELRSIEISRRSSVASARGSEPVTPMESRRQSVENAPSGTAATTSPKSPLQYKGGIVFPSPPSVPPRRSSLTASPPPTSQRRDEVTVPKRRLGRGSEGRLSSPAKDFEPSEDNFDRHVSEVLDRVHAPIKFRRRLGAETPQPSGPSRPTRLPKAGEKKNMTLAPAEPSPRKATPADPEVKLYHLTQAGRSEPIKLFVRLVGEGERVMVRVGGGWADLADYLRQYAEHHGSRTVSEGTLELQTAAANAGNGNGNGAKRTLSGPSSSSVAASDSKAGKSPVTPLMSVFPPFDRPRTRDSEKSWLGREQPEFSMGSSSDSSPQLSPAISLTTRDRQVAAPRRSSLLSSSRPSTAQSLRAGEGPLEGAGSSPGGIMSLAGPSKGKTELPEQKARWVEGMLQQVGKGGSAERSREEKERVVGELGRVGGVRRVVFRGGNAGTLG